MRESSKKNLKIAGGITILLSILLAVILGQFVISNKIYYVIPFCIVIIGLSYFVALYCRYKGESIVYDRKGYDTVLLYINPIMFIYKGIEKKITIKKVYDRHRLFFGVCVPKFSYPKSKDELNSLKNTFTFGWKEYLGGGIIGIIIGLFIMYFGYLFVDLYPILYCLDVFLTYFLIFSAGYLIFSILEGDYCLDIKLDDYDKPEVNEDGNVAIVDTYLEDAINFAISSKAYIYGSYNDENTVEDGEYLLNIISKYLSENMEVENVDLDRLQIVDFVIRQYMDYSIDEMKLGFSKYIEMLVESFYDIVVEKKSKLKSEVKDYIQVCHHIVAYYVKNKRVDDGKALYEKLNNVELDPKKDLEIIYLKDRNAAILELEDAKSLDSVLTVENIKYNGLDMISMALTNYVNDEMDMALLDKSKGEIAEIRKERVIIQEVNELEDSEDEEPAEKKGLFSKLKKNKTVEQEEDPADYDPEDK